MPPFVDIWRNRRHRNRPASAPGTLLASNTSSLRFKIHPDLNALVAQLDGSRLDDSFLESDLPSTISSGPDFLPLKPRARGRPYSAPSGPTPLPFVTESQDDPEQDENAYIASPAFGDAWSTFGRGTKACHALVEDVCSLNSMPGTPSSLEIRRKTQPRTPTSAFQSTEGSSSVSRSTQTRNRSSPSSHNDLASTSYRPGRRSSSSSYHTFGRHMSPPHMSVERLPPLPPLAHPAIQSHASGTHTHTCSSSSNVSSIGVLDKYPYPRHYASMPSMSTARVRMVSAHRETSGSRQIDERNGSVIRIVRSVNHANRLVGGSHGNGNRRSGAEYSPIQTIVTNREAQFSREMADLAVRDAKEGHLPILGNACVDNVSCRQLLKLGNPILLQRTNCHTVPQAAWHGDSDDFLFTHDITRSEKSEAKSNEMTKPDPPTHHKINRSKDNGTSLLNAKGSRRQAIHTHRAHPVSPRRSISQPASESLLVPPVLSLTSPTPEISPVSLFSPPQSLGSFSGANSTMPPALKPSITRTSGKRKADEADVEATPSKKATFAPDQRPHRVSENSGSSYAPSSYRHKRARLSTSSDSRNLSRSTTMSSLRENLNAGNTGSLSSHASTRGQSLTTPYHRASRQSIQSQRLSNQSQSQRPLRESLRRQSLSGASIPISALVSPHVPSVARRKMFHMHDPRKPGPIQRTSWILSLPSSSVAGGSRWTLKDWVERGGSPLHAWLFFLGFLFFPVWWLAAFIGTPRTRRIGEGETEKGVILDDPQVEHDSKSWRMRCRVMSVISFFTYVPFIVLVAIFVRH